MYRVKAIKLKALILNSLSLTLIRLALTKTDSSSDSVNFCGKP